MARPTPGLLVALLAAFLACTTPRTQIVLLIETDMDQGPAGPLTHIRVTVGQPGAPPRQRLTYRLGGGATSAGLYALPGTLGISALDNDGSRSVEVKVDAVSDPGGPGSGADALFTYTAIAPFEDERTLLMPVFLAGRCRTAPPCQPGYTCGRERCEQVARTLSTVPSDFRLDAGAADVADAADVSADDLASPDAPDAPAPDATALDALDASATDASDAADVAVLDAGDVTALDGGDAADATDAREASAPDATDAAPPDAVDAPATCSAPFRLCAGACVDTSVNPLHCGSCGVVCMAPPHTVATCGGGACRFACDPGYVDCDLILSNGCELHEGDACTSTSGCATGLTSCRAGPVANFCEATSTVSCGTPCPPGAAVGVCDGLGACRGRTFACDGGGAGPDVVAGRDVVVDPPDGGLMTLDGALM